MIRRKKLLLIFACLPCLAFTPEPGKSYVAASHCAGRFGDKVIAHLRAITAAHRLGLPYLFRPYPGLEKLALSTYGEHICREDEKLFDRVVYPNSLPACRKGHSASAQTSTLYKVRLCSSGIPMVSRGVAKKLLAPIVPLEQVVIPEGCVSVAVHIRTGGEKGIENGENKPWLMDHPRNQHRFPRKFIQRLGYGPYINGLRRIRRIFRQEKLYVHIFTDDKRPGVLAERIRCALKDPNMSFDYRLEGNHHSKNVVEDFYNMTRFNCLIRPDSNLSKMAEYIGHHAIILGPGCSRISTRACASLKQHLQQTASPQTETTPPQYSCTEGIMHDSKRNYSTPHNRHTKPRLHTRARKVVHRRAAPRRKAR